VTVTTAILLVLLAAGVCFGYRLWRGPTLVDRVIAVDGLIVAGVAALVVNAMRTGLGSFVPVAVVASLVGFVSTSAVARYVEGRSAEPLEPGDPPREGAP
jgi:multisubunit Na+/H+ antiporter MnhF subunit